MIKFKEIKFALISIFAIALFSCSFNSADSDEVSSSSSVWEASSSSLTSSSSIALSSSSSEIILSSSATEQSSSSNGESSSSSSVLSSSSAVQSSSSSSFAETGTFTDTRDEQVYKYVTIGSQIWMAENLNYDTLDGTGSWCYNNSADNCEKYGRLYNWETAKAACPSGWHLPSDAEWTALTDYVGGTSAAGTKLKAASGWNAGDGYIAGTDDYGFSALPGGNGTSDGGFSNAGGYGYWWSASEVSSNRAYDRNMYYNRKDVSRLSYGKDDYLFSVRCLKD